MEQPSLTCSSLTASLSIIHPPFMSSILLHQQPAHIPPMLNLAMQPPHHPADGFQVPVKCKRPSRRCVELSFLLSHTDPSPPTAPTTKFSAMATTPHVATDARIGSREGVVELGEEHKFGRHGVALVLGAVAGGGELEDSLEEAAVGAGLINGFDEGAAAVAGVEAGVGVVEEEGGEAGGAVEDGGQRLQEVIVVLVL